MKAAAQKWSSPFQGTRVMLADKVHGVNRKLETSFLCTVYTEWTERIYIGICVTVHGNKCQRWVGFNTFLEGKNTQIYITLFNPMWTQDSVAKNAYKISLLNIFHINIASNCWATRYLVLNKCIQYLTVNKRTWRVRQGHFEVLYIVQSLYIPVIDIQKKGQKVDGREPGDVLLNIYWCG